MKLCRLVVYFLLALTSAHAFSFSVPSTYRWTSSLAGFNGGNVWPDQVAACKAAQRDGTYLDVSPLGGTPVVGSSYACRTNGQWGPTTQYITVAQVFAGACPANSTGSSSCTCNSGYLQDGTNPICVPAASVNCAAVSGQIAGSINSPYTPGAPLNSGSTSLCDPGSSITGGSTCAVSVSYDFATQVGTSWIKQGTGTFTGTPCTESSSAPTPQPPTSSPTAAPTINPCSPGSVPGTVNGQSVCSPVADRNVVAAGPTSTASAPSGSSGLLPNAPPTAVKSTEQTTCTGGNCTTTKTYTDSAGVIVGTASKQQSQGGFCAENPGASVCQSSATDTPLPAQPKLYEPEFPGGLAGVWETRKAELTASPLLSIVPSLMPNVGAGGTCPSWNIDLDVGIGNYGLHNVAPPCWLWDVAKAIVIISSLLLARALVFGG